MGIENAALLAFNRGIISRLGLARVDLQKRVAMSAEIQTNWIPRVLGSMMLRPGLAYIGPTKSNARAFHIPFVFATDDHAILELTDSVLRVRVGETLLSRTAVSTTFTNGAFNSDVAGWTGADEGAAVSAWLTGGYLSLTGTHYSAAIRRQTLTVSGADLNVEHGLRVVIERGPVTLKVGSTSGGDEYIHETSLGTGTHSLAFTPTAGSAYVELSSLSESAVLVDSISIEAAGTIELPTPWPVGALRLIRYDQSGDIIYIACDGYQQRKIERRATRSWSIVKYEATDGPFRIQNVGTTTLTPSAISGDIALTASRALFRAGHVGALFRLTSIGQRVAGNFTGVSAQFTSDIRVTGIGSARLINIEKAGTWTGTLTLQRSVGEPGSWADVTTYTTNPNTTYNDGLDNQIIFYRIGVKASALSSGTINAALDYPSGGLTGVARIKTVTTPTSATASVLKSLGGTGATEDWSEGAWSDYRGWPSAVAFYEGRLWWTGKGNFWGSVSDAYESFDDETEGDSGPIDRSIGSGPVDTIAWLLPLQRLIAGTAGAEHSARSSTQDEPLTPTNFNLKTASTQGSGLVDAAKIDSFGVFVQRSGTRLFQLAFSFDANDYTPTELTALAPEVCNSGVVRIGVQRQPDTRIHCVLNDGTVAIMIFDKAEDVKCWVRFETDGEVEDIVVLPGAGADVEDAVYYAVARTIGGSTVRYLERWALEENCHGGSDSRCADSHLVYSGASTVTVAGLGHLEGESVVAWGDGADLGTYTVTGGAIVLSTACSQVCVGLPYTARYKSTKLAYAAQLGTALTQRKRVTGLGLVMIDTHAQGLKYGGDFASLDDLPQMQAYAAVDQESVWSEYDYPMFPFPGSWSADSRLCLQAAAPRPCTVLAAIVGVQTHDHA